MTSLLLCSALGLFVASACDDDKGDEGSAAKDDDGDGGKDAADNEEKRTTDDVVYVFMSSGEPRPEGEAVWPQIRVHVVPEEKKKGLSVSHSMIDVASDSTRLKIRVPQDDRGKNPPKLESITVLGETFESDGKHISLDLDLREIMAKATKLDVSWNDKTPGASTAWKESDLNLIDVPIELSVNGGELRRGTLRVQAYHAARALFEAVPGKGLTFPDEPADKPDERKFVIFLGEGERVTPLNGERPKPDLTSDYMGLEEVDLVAIRGERDTKEKIGTCDYKSESGATHQVDLFKRSVGIMVYDRRTGEVVNSKDFRTRKPTCSETTTKTRNSKSIEIKDLDVMKWLKKEYDAK